MRWVRCGFWITAWGAWVWLGVGLYHQLPRRLGPASCTLPAGRDCLQLGFIGDTDHFAVLDSLGSNHAKIGVYDASNGSIAKEMPWSASMHPFGILPKNTDDPMLVIVSDFDQRSASAGVSVFNLRTFESQRLSNTPNRLMPAAVDAKRMIGLFLERGNKSNRMVFVDLSDGTELGSQTLSLGWSFNGFAFDDSAHGLIAYSVGRSGSGEATDPEKGRSGKLEIWRIGRPPINVATVAFAPREVPLSASCNGRITFTRIGTQAPFRVLDFARQEWIFERNVANEPPYDPRNQGVANEPLMSPSGQAALDGTQSSLWRIETGDLLWSRKDHEVVRADRRDATFLVREDWTKLLPKRLSSLRYETSALRDLESGDLILRTSGKDIDHPVKMNVRRSLVALRDGTIHRLPLPVNCSLLAFCQSILALPLVLLWLALRWRRKRRERRLAGATA